MTPEMTPDRAARIKAVCKKMRRKMAKTAYEKALQNPNSMESRLENIRHEQAGLGHA